MKIFKIVFIVAVLALLVLANPANATGGSLFCKACVPISITNPSYAMTNAETIDCQLYNDLVLLYGNLGEKKFLELHGYTSIWDIPSQLRRHLVDVCEQE